MKLAFTNCNSMCTLVTVHMDSTLLKNKSIKSKFLTEKKIHHCGLDVKKKPDVFYL